MTLIRIERNPSRAQLLVFAAAWCVACGSLAVAAHLGCDTGRWGNRDAVGRAGGATDGARGVPRHDVCDLSDRLDALTPRAGRVVLRRLCADRPDAARAGPRSPATPIRTGRFELLAAALRIEIRRALFPPILMVGPGRCASRSTLAGRSVGRGGAKPPASGRSATASHSTEGVKTASRHGFVSIRRGRTLNQTAIENIRRGNFVSRACRRQTTRGLVRIFRLRRAPQEVVAHADPRGAAPRRAARRPGWHRCGAIHLLAVLTDCGWP